MGHTIGFYAQYPDYDDNAMREIVKRVLEPLSKRLGISSFTKKFGYEKTFQKLIQEIFNKLKNSNSDIDIKDINKAIYDLNKFVDGQNFSKTDGGKAKQEENNGKKVREKGYKVLVKIISKYNKLNPNDQIDLSSILNVEAFNEILNSLIDFDEDEGGSNVIDIRDKLNEDEGFAIEYIEDTRKTETSSQRAQRQSGFRGKIIEADGGQGIISGNKSKHSLKAAHIIPYFGEDTDKVSNGIFLDATLHDEFDNNNWAIDPKTMKVIIGETLKNNNPNLIQYDGKKIKQRKNSSTQISREALEWRFVAFRLCEYFREYQSLPPLDHPIWKAALEKINENNLIFRAIIFNQRALLKEIDKRISAHETEETNRCDDAFAS